MVSPLFFGKKTGDLCLIIYFTYGVTPTPFPSKTWRSFLVTTFSLPAVSHPPSDVDSPVFFFHSGVTPLDEVTQAVPPSDAWTTQYSPQLQLLDVCTPFLRVQHSLRVTVPHLVNGRTVADAISQLSASKVKSVEILRWGLRVGLVE